MDRRCVLGIQRGWLGCLHHFCSRACWLEALVSVQARQCVRFRPPALQLPRQAVLLAAVYFVDRSWAKRGLLPPWYMKMRLPLTVLAASGLAMTAATG